MNPPPVTIRSPQPDAVEVSWFAPLCDDDFEFLGVKDPRFKSTWEHVSEIVRTADHAGFDNILCPSGYVVGQDTLPFAAAIAPQKKKGSLLAAVCCGEVWPPPLGRTTATTSSVSRPSISRQSP